MRWSETADPSAALGMTKGRGAFPSKMVAVNMVMGTSLPHADDWRLISSRRFMESAPLPFVIPSAAEGSAVLLYLQANAFRVQAMRSVARPGAPRLVTRLVAELDSDPRGRVRIARDRERVEAFPGVGVLNIDSATTARCDSATGAIVGFCEAAFVSVAQGH